MRALLLDRPGPSHVPSRLCLMSHAPVAFVKPPQLEHLAASAFEQIFTARASFRIFYLKTEPGNPQTPNRVLPGYLFAFPRNLAKSACNLHLRFWSRTLSLSFPAFLAAFLSSGFILEFVLFLEFVLLLQGLSLPKYLVSEYLLGQHGVPQTHPARLESGRA